MKSLHQVRQDVRHVVDVMHNDSVVVPNVLRIEHEFLEKAVRLEEGIDDPLNIRIVAPRRTSKKQIHATDYIKRISAMELLEVDLEARRMDTEEIFTRGETGHQLLTPFLP